jgi:filamentous hemagglutinin
VTAREHTWQNGAVIDSTATADKNRLNTGTLGFSNIENHAYYKTEHQSVGMSRPPAAVLAVSLRVTLFGKIQVLSFRIFSLYSGGVK